MGLENYLAASALKGVLAQRLVRVNCPECRESYRPADSILQRAGLLELADVYDFQRGTGCPQCKKTGFKGQTGIFEFVEITPYLSELIMRNASMNQIREEARKNGHIPLFEIGLERLRTGVVSLEELLKETYNIDEYYDLTAKTTATITNASPV
jgi:type II secretory ATPase GspE/PulE/Tfp pilus assembly ATPase PilB-like protein